MVKLEVSIEEDEHKWVSWLHDREWRCTGDFRLPKELVGVLVKTPDQAKRMHKWLKDKEWTRSIIPLEVVCQGLIHLK